MNWKISLHKNKKCLFESSRIHEKWNLSVNIAPMRFSKSYWYHILVLHIYSEHPPRVLNLNEDISACLIGQKICLTTFQRVHVCRRYHQSRRKCVSELYHKIQLLFVINRRKRLQYDEVSVIHFSNLPHVFSSRLKNSNMPSDIISQSNRMILSILAITGHISWFWFWTMNHELLISSNLTSFDDSPNKKL
jgi:hypothetical protein